jgi:single-strand DNA-binding protein
MLSLRNQVTIVGDFGQGAQITTFESGAMVARFSVGIEPAPRIKRSEGSRLSNHRMFAWGNTAEFINQFCAVGKRVAVTGRLVNRTYLGPQGDVRKVTEVEVRQVVIL